MEIIVGEGQERTFNLGNPGEVLDFGEAGSGILFCLGICENDGFGSDDETGGGCSLGGRGKEENPARAILPATPRTRCTGGCPAFGPLNFGGCLGGIFKGPDDTLATPPL
jgi:hypothetical protein